MTLNIYQKLELILATPGRSLCLSSDVGGYIRIEYKDNDRAIHSCYLSPKTPVRQQLLKIVDRVLEDD